MSLYPARNLRLLIEEGRIGVECHFHRDKSERPHFRAKCERVNARSEAQARAWLGGQLNGIRFGLTLGPLLKQMSGTTDVSSASRYANNSSIFDLRSADHYELLPNASVSAYTNEVLYLPDHIAGFIVGRVTHDANGLNVKTSYLQMGWSGFIKIRIRNDSSRVIRLKLGMDIAGLFLFDVNPAMQNSRADSVEQGAHFRGNWGSVLGQCIDPFSEAVEKADLPARSHGLNRLFSAFGRNWQDWLLGGVVVFVLTGMITLFNQMYEFQQRTADITTANAEAKRLLQESKAWRPLIGVRELVIQQSKSDGETYVEVPNSFDGEMVVAAWQVFSPGELHNPNAIRLYVRATISTLNGQKVIVLHASAPKPLMSPTVVEIGYAAYPR